MTDTLDFVKNLWGSMSVPGLTAPTLSVDDLDKKINDLKAVEAWLNLNMSMLRGSIQALEVQRNTIATLKSVGASLAAAVNQGADTSKFESNPYMSAFFQQPSVTPPKAAEAAVAPAPAAAAPAPNPASGGASAAKPADASDAAQLGSPAVWWNLLQDQFKQAVSTAMSPEAVAGATARATETAAKFVVAAGGKPPAATASSASGSSASVSAKAADKPALKAEAEAKPAAKKAPAKRATAGKA
ncbi:PhaM family polyhydroxyalkanoate granule multifunctional regulatory protein [Rugamonas rubra]|nr:PhaM family polyhydroxyalkanoate granule multifunctional regulatory protein [Rugamonas rubra]